MPTATVYANRAGVVKSRLPHTSFPQSGLDAYIAYYGATTQEHEAVFYGFSVPKSLYGKQVKAGYLSFNKSNSTPCYPAIVYYDIHTPDQLNTNTVTWDGTHRLGGTLDIITDPASTNQRAVGRTLEHIARGLNGVFIAVDTDYIANLTKYTTIKSAPSFTFDYSDTVIPSLKQEDLKGYRNPHEIIQLPFLLVEDITGPISLTAMKLRWRRAGEAGYTEVNLQPIEYVTDCWPFIYPVQPVPPNTFPTNSTVEWQLQLQVNGQWWSQNTAWNTLSTVDSISTASPVEPVNAMLDVEVENTFRWQHVIATGSAPTGYELQYSIDGYNWRALAARTGTAETSCTVAANTLPAGKLQWRVRTLNGDGIAGTWSEPAAIIGYGAPPAPIISEITNTARPTIRWQSDTQIAYELIIRQGEKELLHVGETAGTDKAYTVSDFLADGTYTVLVRIENSGLYWSQWASAGFAIQTQKPAPPVITGQPVQNGVMVTTAEVPDTLYLLRDGVPIAKLYGGQAVDYGVVGPHEYVVRRVNATGAYADSPPLVLETKVEQAVIAPADDPGSVIGPLLQAVENEYPSTANLAAEMKHYAGRRYPVAVTAGAIEEEFSPVLAALNPAHWRALRSLMEEAATVLYRNSAGDCAYCLIIALNPTKAHGGYMTWETTLARVDYVERIEYDEVI